MGIQANSQRPIGAVPGQARDCEVGGLLKAADRDGISTRSGNGYNSGKKIGQIVILGLVRSGYLFFLLVEVKHT